MDFILVKIDVKKKQNLIPKKPSRVDFEHSVHAVHVIYITYTPVWIADESRFIPSFVPILKEFIVVNVVVVMCHIYKTICVYSYNFSHSECYALFYSLRTHTNIYTNTHGE